MLLSLHELLQVHGFDKLFFRVCLKCYRFMVLFFIFNLNNVLVSIHLNITSIFNNFINPSYIIEVLSYLFCITFILFLLTFIFIYKY